MVIAVEETRSFFGERYVGIREVDAGLSGNPEPLGLRSSSRMATTCLPAAR